LSEPVIFASIGHMALNPYIGILMLLVVSSGFLVTMLVLSSVLGPKNRTTTKQLPFECGSVSVGSMRGQRFNVSFYLVAMLFVVFDIEVMFLYPWAVALNELGWYGFNAMLIFILVLAVGLIYEWKRGVLDWSDAEE